MKIRPDSGKLLAIHLSYEGIGKHRKLTWAREKARVAGLKKLRPNFTPESGASGQCYRLFVAVPLPEQVKSVVATVQVELGLLQSGVAWTRAEHLHVTLKFVGNVAAARVEALIEQLYTACKTFSPLELRAEHVGVFPDMRFPRVIWIGVSDTDRQLTQLHKAVELATSDFTKEEPEESFIPHATIARVKHLNARDRKLLLELVCKMDKRFFGEWSASEIELVRSELSSQGARHTCVARIQLTGNPKAIS